MGDLAAARSKVQTADPESADGTNRCELFFTVNREPCAARDLEYQAASLR